MPYGPFPLVVSGGAPTQRPIRQIINAVAGVMQRAGDTSTHYYGDEHLAEQYDAAGRYVWVPVIDNYIAPFKGGNNPRSLFTSSEQVAIHIWGAVGELDATTDPDVYYDAAYIMRSNLLVALRRVLAANFVPNGSGWLKTRGTVGQFGRVYVLNVTLDIPVVDATVSTAIIRHIVARTYGTDGTPPDELDTTITLP